MKQRLPLYEKVLKDMNLVELQSQYEKEQLGMQIVNLESSQSEEINRIIRRDSKFLSNLGLMDYSLNLVVE